MSAHTFDQCSWRVIKEFAGIYNINMDYTKVAKIPRDKFSNVYFNICKFPTPKVSVTIMVTYDHNGTPWRCTEDLNRLPTLKRHSAKEWKAIILKRMAQGYKNKQLYEKLAKLVAPPPKVACICGLKMGTDPHQKIAHYRTHSHINRMLKCVPVSKVADSTVPSCGDALIRMGYGTNAHTISLHRWSNAQRRFIFKRVDLRPYMEQRERFTGSICYTAADILQEGGLRWTQV
jgi:hypothetical protein